MKLARWINDYLDVLLASLVIVWFVAEIFK